VSEVIAAIARDRRHRRHRQMPNRCWEMTLCGVSISAISVISGKVFALIRLSV